LQNLKDSTGEDNPPQAGFLRMQEYGFWKISEAKDMRHFAAVILSLVYEAEKVLEESQ
jgi:hypothetical protein